MINHVRVPRRTAVATRPFGSFGDLDRVFDGFFRGIGPRAAPAAVPAEYRPRIDFEETDTEMVLAAELPGLEEKDIEVALDDGVLTIRGERRDERDESDEEKGVRHLETFRGRFSRSLRLPAEVDADAVTAHYRNGVLTVTLPKPPEAQPSVRSIPITGDE